MQTSDRETPCSCENTWAAILHDAACGSSVHAQEFCSIQITRHLTSACNSYIWMSQPSKHIETGLTWHRDGSPSHPLVRFRCRSHRSRSPPGAFHTAPALAVPSPGAAGATLGFRVSALVGWLAKHAQEQELPRGLGGVLYMTARW